MEIIRRSYHPKKCKYPREQLTVTADVYFDTPELFCGRTWISLLAWKERHSHFSWEHDYTIQIAVHDQDDYDIGWVYYPEPDQFTNVLHELINWMNDLEHGVICHDDFVDTYYTSFFPDYCGCKRKPY